MWPFSSKPKKYKQPEEIFLNFKKYVPILYKELEKEKNIYEFRQLCKRLYKIDETRGPVHTKWFEKVIQSIETVKDLAIHSGGVSEPILAAIKKESEEPHRMFENAFKNGNKRFEEYKEATLFILEESVLKLNDKQTSASIMKDLKKVKPSTNWRIIQAHLPIHLKINSEDAYTFEVNKFANSFYEELNVIGRVIGSAKIYADIFEKGMSGESYLTH